MLDDRIIQLINADLDGELGPAETAELEALLESSSEARSLKAELLKLTRLFDGLPEQTPPPELAGQVLEQLAPSTGGRGFSLAGIFQSFRLAPAGLAFATGLLLTVGFYELTPRQGSAIDAASVVGAMVANRQNQPLETTDSMSFNEHGLSGTVSLQESSGFFILSFDFVSDKQTEIEVGMADAGLDFSGMAHTNAGAVAGDETYEISEGTLRVTRRGKQAFTVFLRDTGGQGAAEKEISIVIFSGGSQLASGVLKG